MRSDTSTGFRVGERVPGTDWVMRGVVGQGGMGVVLEVSKGRNLRAAMKVLRRTFARSAQFEARFAEEVEVMARLRHPNIVEVWDCGVLSDGSPFLLMELLSGRTIRAIARDKNARFTAEAIWQIAGQICAGLGRAHSDHPPVVHRDVKPENVFLHGPRHFGSRVKLLDFGVAKVLDAARPAEEVAGTPRYIAPEVLRKEPLSPKVDLYALAVLVYELLTQAYPWRLDVRSAEALSEAHLKRAPLPPSRWRAWIPKSVDDCLLRALSKNPEERQRSVAEFHAELAELQVADDGSATYRTDAPTNPTVETLARGRVEAHTTDSALRAATEGSTHAFAGGWLEVARSRLTDEAADADVVSAPDAERARARNLRPEGLLEEGAAGDPIELASPDNPAKAIETPLTGASEHPLDSGGRKSASSLAIVAAVIAVVGTWGGWKAWHSPAAREQGSLAADRSQGEMALAPAIARSTAHPGPPAASTAPDPGPAAETSIAVAAENSEKGPPLPAPPARRKATGRRSTPPPSNLDDVLFGEAAETQLAAGAPNGGRGAVATPPAGSGRSTPPGPTFDEIIFGSAEAPSGPRSAPQKTPASTASAEDRASRSEGGPK